MQTTNTPHKTAADYARERRQRAEAKRLAARGPAGEEAQARYRMQTFVDAGPRYRRNINH